MKFPEKERILPIDWNIEFPHEFPACWLALWILDSRLQYQLLPGFLGYQLLLCILHLTVSTITWDNFLKWIPLYLSVCLPIHLSLVLFLWRTITNTHSLTQFDYFCAWKFIISVMIWCIFSILLQTHCALNLSQYYWDTKYFYALIFALALPLAWNQWSPSCPGQLKFVSKYPGHTILPQRGFIA